jgi:uncharacterized RDD family membrane protein YckC
VSTGGAPPGWYPDPGGGGGQRYFDGAAWTGHTAAPPPPTYGYAPWGAPAWKGARYGRPQHGPGSLTDPGKRLVARILDGLIYAPVFIVFAAIAIALVAPHVGPVFPTTNADGTTNGTPGFLWIYLAVFAAMFVGGVLFVFYEGYVTARYGRTLGKRWMKIRPVTLDGRALGFGTSFGRAGLYWIASALGWLGLIDQLWCLWDADSQCIHDKVAATLVVND